MSNVIRTCAAANKEKLTLRIKSCSQSTPSISQTLLNEIEALEENRRKLLLEIEQLKVEQQQIEAAILHRQTEAETELQVWWADKEKEALENAKTVEEEARSRGYKEAYSAGSMAIEQELAEKRQAIEEIYQTANEDRKKIIASAESFLLSLSISIAKKIVRTELAQQPEQMIHTVKGVLQEIQRKGETIVQIAMEDYPKLQPSLEELKSCLNARIDLQIIPSEHLSAGDFIIETAYGTYDGKIDSQLTEIRKYLLDDSEESPES